VITASVLFAGDRHRHGPHRCYYCGADCDATHSTKDYVKPSFTNRDIVQFPASQYVCEGCVLSLGEGQGDLPMLDGTIKAFTTPRGMAARMYSWLLTGKKNLAFTKAHIALIRGILTDPAFLPDPPFAVILSDTGQKQLIFRATVAWDKEHFPIRLEDEIIEMTPAALKERIDLTTAIVAATGKPALTEKPTLSMYIAFKKMHGNTHALESWGKIMYEPLSRLAAWLAKNKEEAKNEYQSNLS
jgi:hypothetical protein